MRHSVTPSSARRAAFATGLNGKTADSVAFRHFKPADTTACLAIFNLNCPAFFAPEERADYAAFLGGAPAAYEVCMSGSRIVGAFGLTPGEAGSARMNWILLDPSAQGTGLGATMMLRAIERARRICAQRIDIAASQFSEPFFAKFGARTLSRQADGWGPGMHRHDMVLEV